VADAAVVLEASRIDVACFECPKQCAARLGLVPTVAKPALAKVGAKLDEALGKIVG